MSQIPPISGPSLSRTSPTRPAAERAAEPERLVPRDLMDLSKYDVEIRPVRHIECTEEAMALKAPSLERPVLMIHGLAQHADTWFNFKNFFTANPDNPDGGIFHVDREESFREELGQNPQARVFAIDLSDNLRSPQVVAGEVRRAITAILEGTGADQVDLLTHSMGGLVAREALRQGEDRVRNLVMVAPPSHGSMEATLASALDEGSLYSHYPGEKMEAMHALRLEYGSGGKISNEWLHELNQDWQNHSDRVRGSVIAGVGLPTPDARWKGVGLGDGMVAAANAALEGAEFYIAQPNNLQPGSEHFRDFQQFRYNHMQIVSEPEIFRQVSELLTGAPASPPAPEVPREAPSRAELSETLERTAEARKDMAAADTLRQVAHSRRVGGMERTLVGSGILTAGALTAAIGAPLIGVGLSVVGLTITAFGILQSRRNEMEAHQATDATVRLAHQALNEAEDAIHRTMRTDAD